MIGKKIRTLIPLIIGLIVLSLSIAYFPTLNKSILWADSSIQENIPSQKASNPIVVYYSRTGKTRIVAHALKEQLACETAEIKSTENRDGFLGVVTCVLDSLLERDDEIEPFNKDIQGHNPIIIASPIWIGKLSSPTRTFMKQVGLKDKDVYIFLTYNGRLTEEKEKALEDRITSQAIELKGLYKIITKEKTEEDIEKTVITQLSERPILSKKAEHLVAKSE